MCTGNTYDSNAEAAKKASLKNKKMKITVGSSKKIAIKNKSSKKNILLKLTKNLLQK